MSNRIFIDTLFVIALINRRDQYHQQALDLAEQFEGHPLLVTDAVLLEIGNALARSYKQEAVEIIEQFLAAEEVEVVHLTPRLSAWHRLHTLVRAWSLPLRCLYAWCFAISSRIAGTSSCGTSITVCVDIFKRRLVFCHGFVFGLLLIVGEHLLHPFFIPAWWKPVLSHRCPFRRCRRR